jgi:hypothetical protein
MKQRFILPPSSFILVFAARYANRQSGQAQTLATAGSTPACATHEVKHPSAGHGRAQVTVNHPPRAVQVQLLPDGL